MYSPKLTEGEESLIIDMAQKELDEVKCEIIDQENECFTLLNKILSVCDVENAKKSPIKKSYDGKSFEIGVDKTYKKGIKYLEIIEDLKNKKQISIWILFNPDGSIATVWNKISQKGSASVTHRDSGPALIVKRDDETWAAYAKDGVIGREGKASYVKISGDYKELKYLSERYRFAKIIIDKELKCEFPGNKEFKLFLESHDKRKAPDEVSCLKDAGRIGQNCLNKCNLNFERVEI